LRTGVGIAFLASLVFKTKFLRHHHAPLESCMVRRTATCHSQHALSDA
jgi:hypothetical protein